MRLWHVDLLPLLPRLRILGQHSEICGMRGKGWGKKNTLRLIMHSRTHTPIYFISIRLLCPK